MEGWPRLEEDLRAPVAAHFEASGHAVLHEVWLNGRIADLYASRGDDTVAVELKLSDWREAFVQALAYQVGALYTYVALPLVTAPAALRSASMFRRHGIGLLGVVPGAGGGFRTADDDAPQGVPAPDVRVLIEPSPSDRFLPFLADKILRDAKRPKRVPTVVPLD